MVSSLIILNSLEENNGPKKENKMLLRLDTEKYCWWITLISTNNTKMMETSSKVDLGAEILVLYENYILLCHIVSTL